MGESVGKVVLGALGAWQFKLLVYDGSVSFVHTVPLKGAERVLVEPITSANRRLSIDGPIPVVIDVDDVLIILDVDNFSTFNIPYTPREIVNWLYEAVEYFCIVFKEFERRRVSLRRLRVQSRLLMGLVVVNPSQPWQCS
jgi:hypothetical protein